MLEGRDPTHAQVQVRLIAAGTVRARPNGPDLGDAAAPESKRVDDAVLLERREGWVHLALDVAPLRLALWVPAEQIELAEPAPGELTTISIAPTWSDASWIELRRGARVLDGPGGAAFAVMLHDGALRWCGGEPGDGAVEVCVPSPWGELRGTVMCPCTARRGAGG